jgi:hypothetical protein
VADHVYLVHPQHPFLRRPDEFRLPELAPGMAQFPTVASMRAEYERPDGTNGVVTLVEDGTETGIYAGEVVAAVAGVYRFRVLANGTTLRSRAFTREHLLTGAVWQGGDERLPTSRGDPGVERERLCRLLGCLLSDQVIQPEFQRRLKELGLDIDTVRRCLQAWCTP